MPPLITITCSLFFTLATVLEKVSLIDFTDKFLVLFAVVSFLDNFSNYYRTYSDKSCGLEDVDIKSVIAILVNSI